MSSSAGRYTLYASLSQRITSEINAQSPVLSWPTYTLARTAHMMYTYDLRNHCSYFELALFWRPPLALFLFGFNFLVCRAVYNISFRSLSEFRWISCLCCAIRIEHDMRYFVLFYGNPCARLWQFVDLMKMIVLDTFRGRHSSMARHKSVLVVYIRRNVLFHSRRR